MNVLFFSRRAAAAALLVALAGCGTSQTLSAAPGAGFAANSTAGLKAGFKRIYGGIFAKMDGDANGWVDEAEAGQYMSMRDFEAADTASGWGSANRLSKTEFMAWATRTVLWFHDTPDSFANRLRLDLGRAFNRLDANRDGLLVKNEISQADLRRLGLYFALDRVKVRVDVKRVSAEALAAADKNGDKKLSPAEFEDLFVEAVVEALVGAPPAPPAPPAVDPAPVDPAPAP